MKGLAEVQEYTKKIVKSKYFTILLVLIPVFFAFFFRIYPAWLPVTDDWADDTIRNNYIAQVEQQIRQDFPTLPAAQVRARANTLYQDFKKQNAADIAQQSDQISRNLKQRLQLTIERDDGSNYQQTYLLAIDPYLYLRRAENIATTGQVCDEIRDGKCWNNHHHAPFGRELKADYHTYVEAGFILVGSWFGYKSMTSVFFLPAIIAALAVIPTFFIVRRKFGNLAGLVAGIIVGTHVVFLGRTPAGFVDTDVWNVFFPVIATWLFLYGIDKKDKLRYAYIAAAAAVAGLYAQFWSGWVFTFTILFLVLVSMTGYSFARWLVLMRMKKASKKTNKVLFGEMKDSLTLLGIFLAVGLVVVTMISGFSTFLTTFTAPAQISLSLQDPINANLWPNVLTTVAELNTVSIRTIIGQLGGRFFFIAGIFGIFTYFIDPKKMKWQQWLAVVLILLYYFILTNTGAFSLNPFLYLFLLTLPLIAALVYNLFQEEHSNVHYGFLTMGWFVASIFATTQGTRFLLLLVPIIAITVGSTAGWMVEAISRSLKSELKLPIFWGKTILTLVILFLLLAPSSANMLGKANTISKGEIPSMNDAWWDALQAIDKDADQDAIITSWWDFGHWFKYAADRSVNFDGGSQNNPNAHWVGKLLQTDDEVESIGILRMINCGSNRAYETINDRTQNTLQSYHITRKLIGVSTEDAREVLEEEKFSEEEVDLILSYTHCTPPDSYLVMSADMVGKAGVWGHFGLWDFDKAFAYSAYKSYTRSEAITTIANQLDVPEGQATEYYNAVDALPTRRSINTWISPWPGYLGARDCRRINESISCSVGMQVGNQQGVQLVADRLIINQSDINSSYITVVAQGQLVGDIKPSRLIIDGVKHELGGDFTLGINIEGSQALIADNHLVNGLFSRTFYFEDEGEYLTRLIETQQITGGKIIIYKVDWEKYLDDIEQ